MLNPISESGRDLVGYKSLLLLPSHYISRLEGGKIFCSLPFILSSLGTLPAPRSIQGSCFTSDFCSGPTKGVQSKTDWKNTRPQKVDMIPLQLSCVKISPSKRLSGLSITYGERSVAS